MTGAEAKTNPPGRFTASLGEGVFPQTDTADCATPAAGISFAAVSVLNLRIESPLNNNSLFSEGVNARGPAYISFNSRPRT